MKSYSSREIIKILNEDGWYEVGCDGDHHQFKHPTKKGRVTVTHPKKDIPLGTLKSIERQAGVKFPYPLHIIKKSVRIIFYNSCIQSKRRKAIFIVLLKD